MYDGLPRGHASSGHVMGHVEPFYETSRFYPYPRGLAGPETVDFWGLNASSHRKTHWKRWGASPPTFPMGFTVGGAVYTPKIDDLRPGQPPGIRISFGALT